jgi:hypothetical protein
MLLTSGLLIGVLLASASLANPISDRAADVIDEDTGKVLQQVRADIVSASADYRADGIVLNVLLGQLVDPLKDANWASDYTLIEWELDATGDGKPEYTVQYSLDEGKLIGWVSGVNDSEDAPARCEPPGSYNVASGLFLRLEAKCIGSPASFSYRAAIYYDTNADDENAAVATDVVPDKGFAGPVTLGAAPSASPTPPLQALQAGGSSAPAAHTPAPAQPNPAVKTTPNPVPGAPAPAQGAPAATEQASPSAAIQQMARTGPPATTALAGTAAALLLAGLGLVVMARGLPRPAPVSPR